MNKTIDTKVFDDDFLWLFHKVECAAICLSLDHNVIDLNKEAESLFYALKETILNKPITSLFEQIGLKITLYKDKTKQSFKISENKKLLGSQKILNLNWKIKQKTLQNGEIVGFIIYAEKQVNEEKLFMQRLAGSIAHEIRTPLAIININTDLLKRSLYLDKKNNEYETKEKYIKTIKYAVQISSRIIDNILIMIRTLSSGEKIQNDFHNVSITDSIVNVLEIYPFLESEKKLVSFDKSKDFVYYGDKVLTEHMLFNLIKNSLFFIKSAGKGNIKIRLESGKLNNKLIFTDTALGICKDELPYVFDQFAVKKVGSGLGLVFCKTVMQSYGGDIICSSLFGKYTEFTLSFPAILIA